MQPPTHQDLNHPSPRKPVNPFGVALALYVAAWVLLLVLMPDVAGGTVFSAPVVLFVLVLNYVRFQRSLNPAAARPARGSAEVEFAPGRSLSDGVLFTPVRLREGYDMGEVDQLLDRCDAAWLNHDGSMTADDVAAARFTPVKLREGYDMSQVDRHLGRIEKAFRAREGRDF